MNTSLLRPSVVLPDCGLRWRRVALALGLALVAGPLMLGPRQMNVCTIDDGCMDAGPDLSWSPSAAGPMPPVGPADHLILRVSDEVPTLDKVRFITGDAGCMARRWHMRSRYVLAAATAARDDGQLDAAWAGGLRLVAAASVARSVDAVWRAVTATRAEQASRLLSEVWRHPGADGATRARWATALGAVWVATRTTVAAGPYPAEGDGATRWRLGVEADERLTGQAVETILIGAVEAP